MMDPKLKADWIADLRDPDNQDKQTDHRLHSKNDQFCCLGRLCVVAGIPANGIDIDGDYKYDGDASNLSLSLIDKFGFSDDMHVTEYVSFNDDEFLTFAQIADKVEADERL